VTTHSSLSSLPEPPKTPAFADAAASLDHEGSEHGSTLHWIDIARVVLVAMCAAAVWWRLWEPLPRISVIGVCGTVLGGWPIFTEALENLRERRMTMELSMTIALVAALAIGQFFTALVITGFVLVAEILEGLTVARGRRAIRELLDFLPPTAAVRRNGTVAAIPLGELHRGDTVIIAPGACIPVDGTVRQGRSFVDQATITGESVPVEKNVGDAVYAGTLNQSGALEVTADRLGAETSFGKIIDAVEQAERSRAPIQRTADRYAGYLVYFALGCAALTFAITRDARSTISVIIVAGACGIAAGTPLAVLGAIGRAAQEGAIIKGGRHLEALWSVSVVAFDKTGTLTAGVPTVVSIRTAAGQTERTVLATAAIAELRSEHPIGKAIVRRAVSLGITSVEPSTFDYTPGRGVVVQVAPGDEVIAGNTALLMTRGVPLDDGWRASPVPNDPEVLIARGGSVVGGIVVRDACRPEGRGAIDALRHMGIRTVLLTGDARPVADAVAREVQIDAVEADLLPNDKVEAVRRLLKAGDLVAMVGDGINDAPALANATVGVAMGSGTDVTRESADIVLLGNDLSRFVETVRIAKRAHAIIRFNFVGTLAVDAVGVGLAAAGMFNPLLAAFIHVASELTFILNSARLLPIGAPTLRPR
jgi:Cd2+/Zn2+-exporting ATPase/Cu+-exporting ATPase